MTIGLWIVAGVLGISLFGLGVLAGRTHYMSRHDDFEGPRRWPNLVLSIFFTVLALAIGADSVYIHSRMSSFMHSQIDCNTAKLNVEQAVDKQRRVVDQAAADYDIALREYLSIASAQPVVPADNPAYLNLARALRDVGQARLDMIQTYADHPVPNC